MWWTKAQCGCWLVRSSFLPIGSAVILIVAACFVAPKIRASQSGLDDALHAFDFGDYEIARERAIPFAEQGYLMACGIIGLSYRRQGDHVKAYAWYGLAGDQFLSAHQLEGLRLSPEELEAADELMYELGRRYCRD